MNPLQLILIAAIRVYQLTLSPMLAAAFGDQCRYTPSCSVYGMEAVRTHGAFRGGWLAFRRICRCNPWGGCGCDPVPQVNISRSLNR